MQREEQKPRALPRNQKLDVLRGIAILLVIGGHYEYVPVWNQIGWSGVDLFFVLSGFLISGLLFTDYQLHGKIDLSRFWLRRAFKIYPPFYVLIGTTILLLVIGHKPIQASIASDLFFVQNYFPRLWEHEWSLAVEEHFYLFLPLLLLLMIKLSRRKDNPFRMIPLISIMLTIVCLGLRQGTISRGAEWTSIQYPTHLRADSLFAGVALGYYKHFHGESFKQVPKAFLWIAAGIFLAPVFFLSTTKTVMATTFTFTILGFGCILIAAVNQKPSRNPVVRVLAWIGLYSYSIYLWHAPLAGIFKLEFRPTLATFAAYGVLSLGAGFAMAKLVETPSLYLREKWFPSPGPPLPAGSPGDLIAPPPGERRLSEEPKESLHAF